MAILIFLSSTNNFLIHLFDRKMGPQKILSFRVREDLGVMAIKRYSILPRVPDQESHHWMQFNVLARTYCGH